MTYNPNTDMSRDRFDELLEQHCEIEYEVNSGRSCVIDCYIMPQYIGVTPAQLLHEIAQGCPSDFELTDGESAFIDSIPDFGLPIDPAEEATRLAGEARDALNKICNLDFTGHYCDAESMLVVNNMINDLDLVSFEVNNDD